MLFTIEHNQMAKKQVVKIFDDRKVRTAWDPDQEKWYFSVIDVVAVLTDSLDAKRYWSVLKTRMKKEGIQPTTVCSKLKMRATDGKMRMTDVADTEQLFRLIQSIPSPKAEPFKRWMAQIASERVDQMQDPELSIDQAFEDYRRLGYSENWINQRIKSIEVRKNLTDEWQNRGLNESSHFAILTNIITKEWSGLTVKEYKQHKSLKKENLRDNMTNTELILNMLAEASATEISQSTDPVTFSDHQQVARQGGGVAKAARKELETITNKTVVTSLNAKIISDNNYVTATAEEKDE